MKITKAEFARGVVGGDYTTGDKLGQVAFFGRSNVGKSSVINSLTGAKDLVRSSKRPGQTIEANFFRINDLFYLVDFPGYGYAKRSIADRNKMIKRIFWYLEFSSVRPKVIFLIIDSVVGLTKLDWDMIQVIRRNKQNLVIVANKIDKLPKTKKVEILSTIIEESDGIEILAYSAKTNEGREELLKKIESFL